MAKISVIVKDKKTLELKENALKGDIIDLEDIVEVDTSYLENIIDSHKDSVYEARLSDFKRITNAEKENEINAYRNQIELLRKEKDNELFKKEVELKQYFQSKLNELEKEKESNYSKLKSEYELLSKQFDERLLNKELSVKNSLSDTINNLNIKVSLLEEQKKALEESLALRYKSEYESQISKLKLQFQEELGKKDELINVLQRQKASLNVKQTGEDLEVWCDNEVKSYMQNGLFNCTWSKDNTVIREEHEVKGSKADYIFKIFADETFSKELSSICLEMKDENPDSVNKQTNDHYFPQLDRNRNKKNCKYAVLVSNLELDKANDLPIYKVREYENMYVVRPAYLMTFLNLITSLTVRFKELLLSKEKEVIEFQEKEKLIEEFEEIKNTYLDKPLDSLKTQIDNILSSSESIKKASMKIDDSCEKIKVSYIRQIEDKIAKFDVRLNRINKKM